MKKNRVQPKVFSFVSALFLGATFIAGCSHSSSPQQVEDLTWKVPGVGSIYVNTYSHASGGTNKLDYSDGSYQVIASGTFYGKANAILLLNLRNSTDTEYRAFESNGDYSILDSSSGFSPSDWRRYPTGGGSSITQIIDSTYLPDGILFFDTTYVHKFFTRSYIGVENITDTTNVTYATYQIHEATVQVDSVISFGNPSLPDTMTSTTDYWIAPTIGWIVKDSTSNWYLTVLDGCTVK